MDPVTPFDWHRMFLGDHAPLYLLEVLVRVAAIYLFAVALGSATGDSMVYPDVPIVYAWVVITGVVALDWGPTKLQVRSLIVNRPLEGTPALPVRSAPDQGGQVESTLPARPLSEA